MVLETPQGTLTDFMATVNMLKGLIGLGILALPYATMQIGWFFSMVGMAAIAAMTTWCIFLAVLTKQELDSVESEGSALCKTPAQHETFASSRPEAISEPYSTGLGFYDAVVARAYGTSGQIFCALCIAITQFATGVAYIDVFAQNIQNLFPDQFARLHILIALGFMLTAFSAVRTLGHVGVLSILALSTYFFIFFGLVSQLSHDYTEDTMNQSSMMIKRVGFHIGTWFGIVQFALGGLPLAVLIYEDMSHPQNFFKVMTLSFILCWIAYSVFALVGYLNYGERTEEIIFLNFKNDVFRIGSVAAICVMLVFSYVLQMFPIYNCAQQLCSSQPPLDRLHYVAIRSLVIVSTIFVAYFVPSVIVVLDVLGGVAGAMLSFVLPPMVYLKLKKHPEMWEHALCWLMVLLGCVGGFRAMVS